MIFSTLNIDKSNIVSSISLVLVKCATDLPQQRLDDHELDFVEELVDPLRAVFRHHEQLQVAQIPLPAVLHSKSQHNS